MNNRVTIYDIAKAAGVSIATVNRAVMGKPRISEATRSKVLKIIDELGYTANPAAQSMAGITIKIGVIFCETVQHFDHDVLNGVKKAFLDLQQYNLEWDIEIVPQDTPEECNAGFRSAMMNMAEKGCNGIVLLLNELVTGYSEMISELYQKNILTATVVTDLKDSKRVLSVRSDGVLAGKMAADLLSMISKNNNAAVFTSVHTVDISRENLEGFSKRAAEKSLNIVKIYENYDYPELAYKAVDDLIANYPQVSGLYIATSNSAAACKRIKELGLQNKLSVIATDVFDELGGYVTDGIVQATLYQNPKKQGYLAAQTLCQMIQENKKEFVEILIKPQIAVSSNMDCFIE